MRRSLFAFVLVSTPALAQTDATPYLPAETDAVLTVQARRVADSELGKKVGSDLLKSALRAIKPAAIAVEASGLDPMKDFDFITVGMDLDNTDPPRPFALFEGKFDTKKVEESIAAYMKQNPDKVSAVTVGSKSAYKMPGRRVEETMFAAIIDDTKMVVAPTEKDLTAAFAAAAGGRKPVISRELAGLLSRTKSPAPIFLRAWVKGKFNDVKLPDKLQARVQSVEWATAAIGVNKDVTVTLTLGTPDNTNAQQLSDLLGGTVGLLRLQIVAAAEDQPELKPVADLLRATKVMPSGKNVVATGSVKGEAIEKALHPPPPATKEPTTKKK